MKKLILSAALIAILSTASFAQKILAEGKTFSVLGDYRIEIADNPVPIKGIECKAYKISYSNTSMDVTVVVCKDRKCKKYVVLSDKLSVQYVCNNKYFGVEMLDEAFAKDGYRTTDSGLNRSEYFHQKVLNPGDKSELEATQFVAAYFPFLINDPSDITAVK